MTRLPVCAMIILTCFKLASTQEWSACSKPCGGGKQTKTVKVWGIFGTSYRSCNTDPCVGGWNIWGPCSKKCGGGSRFKVAKCALNNLYRCPKTYGDCKETPCPAIKPCPSKHVHRYKDASSCCAKTKGGCGTVDSSVLKRIFGGKVAEPGQWPWAVVIIDMRDNIGKCAASLIHPLWAVTAAHCFMIPTDKMKLRFGTISIKNPAQDSVIRYVEKGIQHTGWMPPATEDIALLKFKGAVTYTKHIKPVCLPSGEEVELEKTCYAAGWGMSNDVELATRTPSDVLMQVDIRILPRDACAVAYRDIRYKNYAKAITDNVLCAGKHGGVKDSCGGDSGGPLVCQRCKNCAWFLAGVTSFGAEVCGKPGSPAVYTKVKNYESWIKKHVSLANTEYFTCD